MAALRFGSKRRPVPYFRPSFHLRLIAAAILLGILAAGIEAWFHQRIEEGGQPAVAPSPQEPAAAQTSSEKLANSTQAEPVRPNRAEEDRVGSQARAPGTATLPEQIIIAGVEDNRRVVPSEWDQWLMVFNILHTSVDSLSTSGSAPRVSYLQLMAQPQAYRGKLIRTAGIVRRAHRAHTPKNPWGLENYHQLWFQVDDHPTDPVAVWAIELPTGFPLGMTIEERAEVVGYFFKITAYVAGDGTIRRAPLILAKTIHWQRRPVSAVRKPSWETVPYVLIIAATLAGLTTLWVWWRTRPKKPQAATSSPLTPDATNVNPSGENTTADAGG